MQSPQRRSFITVLGGGMVLAAAPALTACGGMPPAAVQAWSAPEEADLRRFVLAHALLAPNPHNRQPWLADLRRESEITLVCDGERLLPETDPFGRQILVGCGAFIELAVMAAAQRGYRADVQVFADGEPAATTLPGGRAVARLVLTRDTSVRPDSLFAHIRKRHTNKSAYDSARAVPAVLWQTWLTTAQSTGLLAGAVTEPERMATVRTLTRTSYEIESTTARTWLESARLLRIGPSEIEQHRDGISVTGTMPRLLSGLGMFDRFEVPKPGTTGYSQVMKRWDAFETGSGYLWLAARNTGRQQQINAGRAYVRMHLQATAAGVDMHPLSQALQEFAEVAKPYREMHAALGLDPASSPLQMLARVGYGVQPAAPSPRRGLAGLVRA